MDTSHPDLMQKAKIKWAIEAVWSCGVGKAPGPDGFTFKFIKQYWETIGIDFNNMVKRFEIDGEILRGCNSSFISLALKIRDPFHIKDYRTISLFGFQYKVIAKVLANRLSKVVNSVVSEVQMAYIKGRQIIDGTLMVNEIISWASKRHDQLFILKRKWINGFLDSGFSSVLVNGSPTKEFKVQNGLRQGDPLSPFLFILAVEALHISLQVAKERNIFEGVEVGHNKIDISHLQFADDALIMGKWSLENAKNRCRILSLQALNIAMLIKWWWRFNYETNSLWKNAILSIYGVRGGLGLEAQPQCRLMSTPWNSIIGLRESLLCLNINLDSVFVRKVCNEAFVKFWEETWYGNAPFKDVYPRLYALESSKSCNINERCNNSLGPLSCSWAWRRPPRSGIEMEQFLSLTNLLLTFDIASCPDSWICSTENNKPYRVSAMRKIIEGCILESDARGIDLHSVRCPICDEDVKTPQHLFIDCIVASRLWSMVANWWRIDDYPKGLPNLITWGDTANLLQPLKACFDATLKDGDTIVLAGEIFELGFFSPNNLKFTVLGVWYKIISTVTIVWVANREVTLVEPTGMKLGVDRATNITRNLTSWKSNDNPSAGFTEMLGLRPNDIYTFGFELSDKEVYYTYQLINTSLISSMTLDSEGMFYQFIWVEWVLYMTGAMDKCDQYGLCGPYTSYSINNAPPCACLEGFEPKLPEEWSVRDWKNGCKRAISTNNENGDNFKKLVNLKLPDTRHSWFNNFMSLHECEDLCARNVSCTAYASIDVRSGDRGCLMWSSELIDIRDASEGDNLGQDIYIKKSNSDLIRKCICNTSVANKDQQQDLDLQLFSLNKIVEATSNFSIYNKLGQGGFGAVYKGVLEEGVEIAVKRLSKTSRQGLDEFQNEVICIAKLQHRNLVKLLGYCLQGEEMMLIYEYMPNKSLDHLLFGLTLLRLYKSTHLTPSLEFTLAWLECSNFKEYETEANTNKVVGALGYISPEYAANGLFLVKSDVFSFGVLVLEIVSGKKNRGFTHQDHHDNLLGHAWRLYKEDKPLELVDEALGNSWTVSEVLQSIHVGLSCVQQHAEDRPSMSSVVHMLSGEGALPAPTQPGFSQNSNNLKKEMFESSKYSFLAPSKLIRDPAQRIKTPLVLPWERIPRLDSGVRIRDTIQLETAVNTISYEYLLDFTSEYGILETLHPELPGPGDRIVDFPEGKGGCPLAKGRGRILPNVTPSHWILSKIGTIASFGSTREFFRPSWTGGRMPPKTGCQLRAQMDLFNLIRAPNPTKVKVGSRPRAPHEVHLLTLTANRVIEMDDPAVATDSSGVPSTIERSPLDFTLESGASDQGTAAPEMPPPEDVPASVAPGTGQAEEVAAVDPPAAAESRKRGRDRIDVNAPPKSLRRDYVNPRPSGSSHGGKSLAAIQLGLASTASMPEDAPTRVNDPDPLSFADPPARPPADVTQSSQGIAAAGDRESENASSPAEVVMGSQLRLRFEQEAKLLRKSVAQVARRDRRIQARELEIKNLEALLEAEANMKKAAEDRSAGLSQELENMRAEFSDLQVSNERLSQQVATLQQQVSGEEKLKAAFEEFKWQQDEQVEQRLVAIQLGLASTVVVPEDAPVGISDPDPLSFADAPSRHPVDVAQSSPGIAAAGDQESESVSSPAEVGSPGSVYQPKWGVTNGSLLDTLEACQDLVDHVAPPGYFSELRHMHNEEFLRQYNVNLARAAEGKSAGLSQELERMRAQFSDLQVSNERLSQAAAGRAGGAAAFADAVSAGNAKVLSEGLRHGLEHGHAQRSLESIEAYDPEAKAKFFAALLALKDLKDDASQDIRDLRPSSSQLTIPVYPEA
nr:G-type lectin S-receptor-like serine/threonine-protein kinase At4g27290 isoform X1 [Tanacetum cinerariifolium]